MVVSVMLTDVFSYDCFCEWTVLHSIY